MPEPVRLTGDISAWSEEVLLEFGGSSRLFPQLGDDRLRSSLLLKLFRRAQTQLTVEQIGGAEPPDPRTSKPELSKRWSRLVRWCLSSDPAQRPQTAEAFRRALEGETRPPRRLSRGRLVAIGLAVAVAVAVVPLVARLRSPRAPAAVTARPVVAVLEAAKGGGTGAGKEPCEIRTERLGHAHSDPRFVHQS